MSLAIVVILVLAYVPIRHLIFAFVAFAALMAAVSLLAFGGWYIIAGLVIALILMNRLDDMWRPAQ